MKNLIGKEFKVLDKGFVRLIDVMGSDDSIVQAARISYGKGTKTRHEDEGLIRYLMRHRHTTPFEQCQIKFHVRVPMDAWRQWIRHRTMSVNEYSTRYSEAINDKQQTLSNEWRLQNKLNKQGSSGFVDTKIGEDLSYLEEAFHKQADNIYQYRLNHGIAREQARKDLPLSTYTEAYFSMNLHNLLHFLKLRMDEHAQFEIRSYANIIGHKIIAKLFPITWKAFFDYQLNAITLTSRDIQMINMSALHCGEEIIKENLFNWFDLNDDGTLKSNLERIEFENKAKKLKIDVPWK